MIGLSGDYGSTHSLYSNALRHKGSGVVFHCFPVYLAWDVCVTGCSLGICLRCLACVGTRVVKAQACGCTWVCVCVCVCVSYASVCVCVRVSIFATQLKSELQRSASYAELLSNGKKCLPTACTSS